MLRTALVLGITGFCFAIACSPDTNDGDGDGGTSGAGGSKAGNAGRAGSGGSTSGSAGMAGRGGSTSGAGGESGGTGGTAGNGMAGDGIDHGGDDPGGAGPGTSGMGGTAGTGGASGSAGMGGDPGAGGEEADAGEGGGGGDAPVIEVHYTFDEGTGTTAADSTGNFGPASLMDGAAWTAGHVGDYALLLDNPAAGATQHVLLPNNVLADCDDMTIALWARLATDGNWTRFFDADGLVNGFIFFTPRGPEGRLFFNIFSTIPPEGMRDQGMSGAYPTAAVLVGEWHHYAATLAGGVGRVYFDGVEIGNNPSMTFRPSDVDVAATGNAKVGKSTFTDPYVNGAIDDLRIACRAYSAAEIAALVQ